MTGQANPELQLQAETYVGTGYQRLLTFEVPGGGFSLFGDAPAEVFEIEENCDPFVTGQGNEIRFRNVNVILQGLPGGEDGELDAIERQDEGSGR